MRYAIWVCFILALAYGSKVLFDELQEKVLQARALDEAKLNRRFPIGEFRECLRTGESVHECVVQSRE